MTVRKIGVTLGQYSVLYSLSIRWGHTGSAGVKVRCHFRRQSSFRRTFLVDQSMKRMLTSPVWRLVQTRLMPPPKARHKNREQKRDDSDDDQKLY